MVKVVHIDNLEVGMSLGAPVKNKFNQVLCSGNILIEEKHLKLFRTWGFQNFEVVEGKVDQNENEIENKSVLNEDLKQLSKYFNWEPANDV
ncbi:MAG: hypothetical protein Q8Q47_07045, partial [Ignavibacteriaceae bacterium]|nr:hypothetical protein [Ignavibacteriaceae bacterium]